MGTNQKIEQNKQGNNLIKNNKIQDNNSTTQNKNNKILNNLTPSHHSASEDTEIYDESKNNTWETSSDQEPPHKISIKNILNISTPKKPQPENISILENIKY